MHITLEVFTRNSRKPAFLTLRAHVTPALPTTTAPAAIVKNMTTFWPTRTRPAANRAVSRLTIWPASPKRLRPSAKRMTMYLLSLLRFPGAPCPILSRSESSRPGSLPGHLVLYYCCLEYVFFWCLCAQTEHICIKIMVKCSEMRCFCD